MENIVNELRTISKRIQATELVNAAFGAQAPVVIHDILPEGWAVDDVRVETEVDLNGVGTRVLDIGVPGSLEAIAADINVDGAGIKTPTVVKYRATAPVPIVATLTTGTSNPTEGVLLITLKLIQVKREA